MIVDIRQIGLGLIAHVAFDAPPVRLFTRVVESDSSVEIVSTDTIDQRSDRAKCAFVKDEVSRDDVH